MSGMRFTVDLFIPQATYDSIPLATKTAIRDKIRQLKSYAVKVNEGTPSEEMTVKATYHVCRHDEGKPCDPEIDV